MEPLIKQLSAAEFLAFERAAETKHEFINGQIIDMPGASLKHAKIIYNIIRFLALRLTDERYDVLPNDLRVFNRRTGSYYYPDVVVTQEPCLLLDSDNDTLLNPYMLFEITSISTQATDKTRKKSDYELIDSLVAYFIVSQYEIKVERYNKQENGIWRAPIVYTNLSDKIDLSFSSITLAEVYFKMVL